MKSSFCFFGVSLGLKFHYGEVLDVVQGGKYHKVVLDNGEKSAKTVIVATGAEPKKLCYLGILNDFVIGILVSSCLMLKSDDEAYDWFRKWVEGVLYPYRNRERIGELII
jgi:thioredoxin reductase